MLSKLLGYLLVGGGLVGLFTPLTAHTASTPLLLAATVDAAAGSAAPDPGGLYTTVVTASSAVVILLGGVLAAAKTLTGYFKSAWQDQVDELKRTMDLKDGITKGQVEDLKKNLELKDAMMKSVLDENQKQTQLLLDLRRTIATGTACPYLRDDGSCSRLATPAPAAPATVVLPVMLAPPTATPAPA